MVFGRWCVQVLLTVALSFQSFAQSNPILFVTQPPLPEDFATVNAVFGNHRGTIAASTRGGDLWIRYPDSSLKNLTAAAGFGKIGLQTGGGIAVRDPAVYWDGTKAIFSMAIGAPERYETTDYVFQLYEIRGLGKNDNPVISKVPLQPEGVNNVMPVYGSDDTILFVSDRPLKGLMHTYPQRDEYESTATNTGIWKLNVVTGELRHLDHAPSGDFDPLIDSFGRIIFTRWDHLQRDQQNAGASYGAFNYQSEGSSVVTVSKAEQFPEPRSVADPDFVATTNTHTINQFFPWMMSQSGMGLETVNHIGRHELSGYIPHTFNNDPGLEEYYGQYARLNQTETDSFLQIREDPTHPGLFLGVNAPEFQTHAAGQLVSLMGAPNVNPEDMALSYLTHPDTASITKTPGPNHSGLYRDPLPLTDGSLLAVHTAATDADDNIGTRESPRSRYAFRIRRLVKSGAYYLPATPLTSGIVKTVSYYDPDALVSYSNVTMWELQPVEVVARNRPTASEGALPAIEAGVLASAGVDIDALKAFLILNDFALVVGRDLTRRDGADRQQPRNLRVGPTVTRADNGKLYDISHLQFFQGDLIRGYNDGDGPERGRRVLAQAMHSVGGNPVSDGPPGSVAIGDDGSIAAFVPAGRALSWQTTDAQGNGVVRERYWLTFQKGEMRVCGSCHGVNRVDQAGNGEPINPPQALFRLLEHWKGLDHTAPLPTPVGAQPAASYSLSLRSTTGRRIRVVTPRRPFSVHLRGPSTGGRLSLILQSEEGRCRQTVRNLSVGPNGTAQVRLRVPVSSAPTRARFAASLDGRVVAQTSLVRVAGSAGGRDHVSCPRIQVLRGVL